MAAFTPEEVASMIANDFDGQYHDGVDRFFDALAEGARVSLTVTDPITGPEATYLIKVKKKDA